MTDWTLPVPTPEDIAEAELKGRDGIATFYGNPSLRETHYHELTDPKVKEIVESELHLQMWDRRRLVFYYGDPKTGEFWGDAEVGKVGRSVGSKPIPLILYNKRSRGGSGMLDHCIIRIDTAKGKKTIYRVPNASDLKPVMCKKCRALNRIELVCKYCNGEIKREKKRRIR